MSDANPYIAEMLRVSAQGYAAHAAERLLEQHPDCAARFGRSAFVDWQAHLAQWLRELAIAVELDEPALFSSQVQWIRDAFGARAMGVEDLRHGLAALRWALDHELPADAAALPVRCIDAALQGLDSPPRPPARLQPDTEAARIALAYVEAAVSGDQRGAARIVMDAAEGGLSIEAAYEQVLLPAQVEIGTMWHLGEIGIAEEHAATETTRTLIALLAWNAASSPNRPPLTLVAGAEGDRHDIGVRATAGLLEADGFRAVSLGGDVPVHELARAVGESLPGVVILSATLAVHLAPLRRAISALRDLELDTPPHILVAGSALTGAPHLAKKLGADGSVSSPQDAVEAVRAFGG